MSEQIKQALIDGKHTSPDGTYVQISMDALMSIVGAPAGTTPGNPWQTVPLPATADMIAAGEAQDKAMRDQGFANAEPDAIYMAMLDAAPPAPSAASTVEPVALDMVRRLVHEFEPGHYHNCPADHKDADPNSCVCFGGHLIRHAKSILAAPTTSPEPKGHVFECPDCGKDIADDTEPHAIDCERRVTSPEPDAVREALVRRLVNLQDHYSTSGQLGAGNERIFAECIAALSAPVAGGKS